MELVKSQRWIYAIIIFMAALLILLGGWWILLVNRLSSGLMDNNIENQARVANMLKWEGSTFFGLIIAFCALLAYLYFQDRKKNSSIQKFFASMTHELKTPLASIKMQSEFIDELLDDEKVNSDQIKKLLARLTEDGVKLENQLDRLLQLSRVELGGKLNLEQVQLNDFLLGISNIHKHVNVQSFPMTKVYADEWALRIIFRNLLENSKNHCADQKDIVLSIESINGQAYLTYNDQGKAFDGDLNQLGELFYKHKSKKGTGIGLYLIKKLMQQMNGKLIVENSPNLKFLLVFEQVQS